jgi:prepilin-type N-terminal cleavage/methylation domain-containing protein
MKSLTNDNKKSRGFTIVELLVVIVVIGILAAITIVSYTGVTARAKTTQAQSNANSAQSVAEAMNADNGSYPATAASFATGSTSTRLPSGMSVVPQSTALTSGTGQTTVTWACLTSCTTPTGGRITYWDYTTGAVSTTIVYVGAGTVGGTYVNPGS